MSALTHQLGTKVSEEFYAQLRAEADAFERTAAQEARFRLTKLLPQARAFLARFAAVNPCAPSEIHCDPSCGYCGGPGVTARLFGGRPRDHEPDCLWRQVVEWLDFHTPSPERRATFAQGAELGCPDCKAGEPHVCPFIMADAMDEPRRTAVLEHMRRELDDV